MWLSRENVDTRIHPYAAAHSYLLLGETVPAHKTVLKLYDDRNGSFDQKVLFKLCGFLHASEPDRGPETQ